MIFILSQKAVLFIYLQTFFHRLDIVATNNNLATILDNGVAFNAGPYMEEYVPNFMQGETRMAYDVFTALLDEGEGFYFFPQKIGYNGVGYF